MNELTPEPAAARAERVACIAGASGLVGRELLRLLSAQQAYARVFALVRRPASLGASSTKLTELVVSFDALGELPRCDDVYVALGTTIKVAGSQQAFRQVDLDYVVAVARAAKTAGAKRLGLVSALGADRTSRVFYNRVKGEAEEAVRQLGYETLVIAQPSLLKGDRAALGQPSRAGEQWTERMLRPFLGIVPKGYRPIPASDVAAALVAAVLQGKAGVETLSSRDMLGAGARAS